MATEIIIASDTHGRSEYLSQLEQAYPHADLFIHCGALEDDASCFNRWIFVRGNNDFDFNLDDYKILTIEGMRTYIFHSQRMPYYNREKALVKLALENDCQIVLFGHTHMAMAEKIHGIWLINPGSMTFPRDGNSPCYARMVIEDANHVQVELIHQEQWPFESPQQKKKNRYWF